MLASYFCAGYGYVISATFIVTIVERMPGLSGSGNLSFIILGLTAAPAVLLWDLIARKTGYLKAIMLALLLQCYCCVRSQFMLPSQQRSWLLSLFGTAMPIFT